MNMLIFLQGWLPLAIAILFGVIGTISMKLSHGLLHRKPTFVLAISYGISFVALTFAMKHLDLSVVYAVWSGIGTVLVSAVGIWHFHERLSARKVIYLTLIIIGVIGIHISNGFA